VLNVLRQQLLAATDFHNPSAVLEGLNRAFPLEKNDEKYFTIWYGVYHRPTRELTYASGGHHAAVVLADSSVLWPLQSNGPVIGAWPDSKYPSARKIIPCSAELYLFSDGVYEIARPDGSWQSWAEFSQLLQQNRLPVEAIVQKMREKHGVDEFEDDFSLLTIKFS
jgi:sigma-B regulation protein RsbU (phosphoserine phosphatase)